MTERVRVVVTGIGAVCALGAGTETIYQSLLAGHHGFAPLSLFSADGYRANVVAEAPLLSLPADPHFPKRSPRSRSEALSFQAAGEALKEAQLDPQTSPLDLILSASTGGMYETETLLTALATGRTQRVEAEALRPHPISAASDFLSGTLGPFRSSLTLCSACAGGAMALALGAMRLRTQVADRVLAGGVDALSRLTFSGFSALSAIDPMPCRPFDQTRRGMTLGEGAAFFVLERAEDAYARGVSPLAELAGFALACEAFHITQPEPDGATATEVMREALRHATLRPNQVGYLSAHGTGTPRNDEMEAHAVSRVFGAHAAKLAVSSQKGQFGHTLAAAGALEAMATIMALRTGYAPPSGGLFRPIDPPTIGYVRTKSVRFEANVAQSNSFGFGGTDASLVFARPGIVETPTEVMSDECVVTGISVLGPCGRHRGPAVVIYGDTSARPAVDRGTDDPKGWLDPDRSRRLDRRALQTVALAGDALADAGIATAAPPFVVGMVAGNAYGSTQESSLFYARVEQLGPRFASPAEFPNLVPSSAAAHASIYHSFRGPTLSVAELGTSSVAALEVARDLMQDGRSPAVMMVAAEAVSRIVDDAVAPACSVVGTGPRGEGGGAMLLERRSHAVGRGARIHARLLGVGVMRYGTTESRFPWLRPPSLAKALVVVVNADVDARQLLQQIGWNNVPVVTVGDRTGWHEAASGIALAVGVASVARGDADEVLVIACAPQRQGVALFSRG